MVGHWYTLPRPAANEPALDRVLEQMRDSDPDRWIAMHVLYANCPCSRRILEHVLRSDRPSGVAEHLLLVGSSSVGGSLDFEVESRARAAGIELLAVSPEALKCDYGIESAPLLLVADPGGAVRYVGGYTSRKQSLGVQDVEILTALMQGRDALELPLFGCGVSKELQDILDPFGLKYE